MTKVDTLGDTLLRLARRLDGLLGDGTAAAPPAELHGLRLLTTDALFALQALEADEARRLRAGRCDRALRRMAADFGTATGAVVDVRVRGDVDRVPHEVAGIVLDVALETFSNISRNARSTMAVVTLEVIDDHVILEIADDGVDLCQRQVDAWGSTVELGLRRIARAVATADGHVAACPLRPRGLRLEARLPLAKRSRR